MLLSLLPGERGPLYSLPHRHLAPHPRSAPALCWVCVHPLTGAAEGGLPSAPLYRQELRGSEQLRLQHQTDSKSLLFQLQASAAFAFLSRPPPNGSGQGSFSQMLAPTPPQGRESLHPASSAENGGENKSPFLLGHWVKWGHGYEAQTDLIVLPPLLLLLLPSDII